VTSSFIGYGLAPRINAAGRISNASKAVELLLAETDEAAKELADELCEINRQRQVEENRIAEQAYQKIEQTHDFSNDRIIVVEDDHWQQGIIGIVASRITERYGLPSIFISFDGTVRDFGSPYDLEKGSGRSVKGLNLVEALNSCEDLLCKYGGHELAAGLTIERGNVDEFRRRINEYAREHLTDDMLAVRYEADFEIRIFELTMQLAVELHRLEPYGVSNPAPTFVLRDVTVQKIIPIASGKHTKLIVSKDGYSFYAMYFGMQPAKFGFYEGDRVDLLFSLDINEYRNVRSLQLVVQDMKSSEQCAAEWLRAKERYEEIRGGATFRQEEEILPSREDFALVYTVLRREFRQGHDTMSIRALMQLLRSEGVPDGGFYYVKLKFILRILQELQVCGVEEPRDGYYTFNIYFNASKTNLEKSSILKKLRSQCQFGE
jgi:single-stranded-DNA-specific exonuclease